jgi:hypothetical protein
VVPFTLKYNYFIMFLDCSTTTDDCAFYFPPHPRRFGMS